MAKYNILGLTGESRLRPVLFNNLIQMVEMDMAAGWTPLGGVQIVAIDDYTIILAQTMTKEKKVLE
jgi:hypothetical protein